MRNVKLTIEYDGTRFNGWQVQSSGERTVQGTLEKALKTIFQKRIRITGSGRTDSGVHALGQVAHFKVASRLTDRDIQRALNARLPDDVVIREAVTVADSFHAQFAAKRKTYRYTILNRPCPPAVDRQFVLHVAQPLDLTAMRREAKGLVGKKDFRSFMGADAAKRHLEPGRNTVRRIYRLDIKKNRDYVTIAVEADGFLYKMVRNIVGTLIQTGQGRRPRDSIGPLIRKRDRTLAGKTAPARGLCLMDVHY